MKLKPLALLYFLHLTLFLKSVHYYETSPSTFKWERLVWVSESEYNECYILHSPEIFLSLFYCATQTKHLFALLFIYTWSIHLYFCSSIHSVFWCRKGEHAYFVRSVKSIMEINVFLRFSQISLMLCIYITHLGFTPHLHILSGEQEAKDV